jgi:hypothetical protein
VELRADNLTDAGAASIPQLTSLTFLLFFDCHPGLTPSDLRQLGCHKQLRHLWVKAPCHIWLQNQVGAALCCMADSAKPDTL